MGAGSQHTRPAERAARWMFIQLRQPVCRPWSMAGTVGWAAGGAPAVRWPWAPGLRARFQESADRSLFPPALSLNRVCKLPFIDQRSLPAAGDVASPSDAIAGLPQKPAAAAARGWGGSVGSALAAPCAHLTTKQVGGCYSSGANTRPGRLPRVAVAEHRSLQAGGPSAAIPLLHDLRGTMERSERVGRLLPHCRRPHWPLAVGAAAGLSAATAGAGAAADRPRSLYLAAGSWWARRTSWQAAAPAGSIAGGNSC